MLEAERSEPPDDFTETFPLRQDDVDVNHRLGGQSRHRRAADMLDRDVDSGQRFDRRTAQFLEKTRPFGLIGDNFDLHFFVSEILDFFCFPRYTLP